MAEQNHTFARAARLGSFFGALLVPICVACESAGPPTTNTSSRSFASLPAKVAFLEQYVRFRRHYHDLDFHVAYQNNGGGLVPGPSDWNVVIAARVPAQELSQWTAGLKQLPSKPATAPADLSGGVDVGGVNEWYASESKMVGVDREHAVVVCRISTM